MFFVYILHSKEGRFYIGSTENIEKRVLQHNNKDIRSWTNRFSDWKCVYHEKFQSRKEAKIRENTIKSYKGGNAWKKLVENFIDDA